MGEAKIEIRIGKIEFSGQGEQDWVAEQLDKIIAQAEKLIQLAPPAEDDQENDALDSAMQMDTQVARKSLPAFLGKKNATTNQLRKFLATAVWLEAKGQKRLRVRDVTAALKTANQSRLSNPSDCLSKNVTKGFYERDGDQFFVTDEGKRSLLP